MTTPDEARITVLFVEDEPLIRLVATDALLEAGFRVIEAADGQGALAQLAAHPEVGLLITDVRMPGNIDGVELSHRVVDRWPHMAIIATSGHAHLEAGDLPRGGVFLSKPYAPAMLVLMATSLIGPPIRRAATPVGDPEKA
jgi:CheY-like chemotaxis protein